MERLDWPGRWGKQSRRLLNLKIYPWKTGEESFSRMMS